MNNPFSLTFGKEPTQMIARYQQSDEIIKAFTAPNPPLQAYMITGVRGSGKTVFMSSIANTLRDKSDWIVIELNSSGEILKEMVAKLYNTQGLARMFDASGINLSFWGIGIALKKSPPITDLETAVEHMLERLKKDGKKVLIAIDEVTNTPEMRYFAGSFQIMLRHDLPVFLIMTGLYESINKLQNEDNLTFLYRAPKIYLEALNIFRISDSYQKILGLTAEQALELAKTTKGYPFAYQVFGYFTFEKKGDYNTATPNVRQYLDEYVYDKMWSELSEKESLILSEISDNEPADVSKIKEHLNMKPNEFSVYRDRLIKKGILCSKTRGKIEFALPFWNDYVKEHR